MMSQSQASFVDVRHDLRPMFEQFAKELKDLNDKVDGTHGGLKRVEDIDDAFVIHPMDTSIVCFNCFQMGH
jgi:hypothetical protein